MDFKQFFLFNKFITPKFITVVYWILMIGSVVVGISIIFSPRGGMIGGVIFIAFGILFSRIWCELILIFFKINENLEKLGEKTVHNHVSNENKESRFIQ